MNKKIEIEKIKIPQCVQDIIPIKVLFRDGMAYMGNERYTKVYRFQDINYAAASADTKEVILGQYEQLINKFECGEQSKITIINKRLLQSEIERKFMLDMKSDDDDVLREEINNTLLEKLAAINHSHQDKLITITCHRRDDEGAKSFFLRAERELKQGFKSLGSKLEPLDACERIRIYHDFFRNGEEELFDFNFDEAIKTGKNFKNYISPGSIESHKDYLVIGDKYARVLYIRDYPGRVRDDIIERLTGLSHNVMVSIDIYPVRTEEAQERVARIMDGIELEATRWQRNQTKNGVVPFDLPYHIKDKRKNIQAYAEEINSGNQMMMFAGVTLVHTADTLEQLQEDSKELINIALGQTFRLDKINFQQFEALNTVLPYGGMMRFAPVRTLTTRGVAALMPFSVQELQQDGGLYYGENSTSHELLSINLWQLNNANMVISGTPGSGKSFLKKLVDVETFLVMPEVDIIYVDPDGEYAPVVELMKGEFLNISAASDTHISAMDINSMYGDDEDPVVTKTEFILTFFEQMLGNKITPAKKSIISRVCSSILSDYKNRCYSGNEPTLVDIYEELKLQTEPEAMEIALEIERFVVGPLNTFAHPTNVNINNRVVCFNIKNLSDELRPVGMLMVLDYIWNRITANRENGRLTIVNLDELQLLLEHEGSAKVLARFWRRCRKFGAGCHGIIQNTSSLLKNSYGATIVKNSQFSIIMNQPLSESEALYEMYKVSPEQLDYVTNVGQGKGVIYIEDNEGTLVPFENDFPKNTKLYNILSTKPKRLEKSTGVL